MKLTPDERVLVGKAIWSEFEKLTGREANGSSAEYDLIRRWMDRGIPLPVLLRGIGETTGKPRTLMACEAAVERAVAYWQRTAGLTAEVEEQWSPERAEAERKRIMKAYGRQA